MSLSTNSPTPRRTLIASALAGLAALVFARRSPAAADEPLTVDGIDRALGPMTRRMRMGTLKEQPLDSMITLERGDDHTGGSNGTHQVLSLIHEERGAKSYPWTLYASLVTHHVHGDATVLQSRLHKYEAGWSAGVHSEAFSHARGVTLGGNIEMHNDYAGPEKQEVIGLNIQASGGPTPIQTGIQIQAGGNHFETDIALKGKGGTGIDMSGAYGVGLNTHGNSIRLAEGACVELDGTGAIRVRYKEGRIEFLNGDRCFGHLDVNGTDHAL
ncbi:MAG: hypothetical protein P4L33_11760 [Capsulimonadaceae bacterium]|nr:hypothetical protein [Capsulimonadaceae bacterium]